MGLIDYVSDLRKIIGTKTLILTGAVVIIVNEEDQILLQNRNDGKWGLPGGLQELRESLEETGQREVREETGLRVKDFKLLQVFSGEKYYFELDHGDQFYSVTAVYVTDVFEGEFQNNEAEGREVRFFNQDNLPDNLTEEYLDYINSWEGIN
ncbi:NUDIX hydrolase [Halobacillus sp. B23F22_1]|uniref:NUDIX hydrolase n=1 Tax=Halobacillus sp. B23F22_1 TaxID=3459514 RepID=UPI00373F92F6